MNAHIREARADGYAKGYAAAEEKWRAENRKLRDALRRIAESGEYVQGWQLRERARAALAATEEPDG